MAGKSTKKLTAEIINEERLKGRPLKMVGPYINAQTLTDFLCLTNDKHPIWKAKPHNVMGINQSGCPECSKYNHFIDNAEIDAMLLPLHYKRLSEYKGMNKPMKVLCLIDGHTWNPRPGDIKHLDQGCPECGRRLKFLTNEYIDNFIKDKPFIRISNYIDSFTNVDWKCKKDGTVWDTKFTEIRRGSGCPTCKNKREGHINEIIRIEYKILDLECQHTIQGNAREYDLDFYFERNGHKIAIEYDGEQHYMPVRFGGIDLSVAEDNYKSQIIRDKQVKELCKEQGINLINIPYWFSDDQVKLALSSHFYCFY
jgi:predicted  nucleic acid-binding Zn-ribbon protein